MKIRESGMPDLAYWESLFDVPAILDAFAFPNGDVVELGCGYGTFTIPLAARIRGNVYALDLDSAMVATTAQRASAAGLNHIHAIVRDVHTEGFGRPLASCATALLFNILHAEDPVALLRAARAVVRPGGLVAVIHWRNDRPTPRGPSLTIRPTAAQILAWAALAGDLTLPATPLDLPPWHYGLKFFRTA
jgi:SAM-dependent methyltransferase